MFALFTRATQRRLVEKYKKTAVFLHRQSYTGDYDSKQRNNDHCLPYSKMTDCLYKLEDGDENKREQCLHTETTPVGLSSLLFLRQLARKQTMTVSRLQKSPLHIV